MYLIRSENTFVAHQKLVYLLLYQKITVGDMHSLVLITFTGFVDAGTQRFGHSETETLYSR